MLKQSTQKKLLSNGSSSSPSPLPILASSRPLSVLKVTALTFMENSGRSLLVFPLKWIVFPILDCVQLDPESTLLIEMDLFCVMIFGVVLFLRDLLLHFQGRNSPVLLSPAKSTSPAAAAVVEEYDPDTDSWTVVAQSPRKRFGCIRAAVDGVFYIIGGLKIGGVNGNEFSRAATAGVEAHLYASSMDLYDVETRVWLRSQAVPGGGCVIAACEAAGYVYVLASHAVQLSFWRFDARRQHTGFGEWCRIKSPPLPAQVRLDGTVRFSCVAVEDKVVIIQVAGCIDDLLRRSGRNVRGLREGLVLVYDSGRGEWSRGPDLPEVIRHAACVSVEC